MELRKSSPVHPLGFMVSGVITLQIIQIINAGLCYLLNCWLITRKSVYKMSLHSFICLLSCHGKPTLIKCFTIIK